MNDSEFRKQYLGDFRANPYEERLRDRLKLYYEQTPDSMPNQVAIRYWRDFKKWCALNGYTSGDINRAKRSLEKQRLQLTKLIDCPVCHKKDQPVRNDAKVCSSACRVKQWRINQRKANKKGDQ